MNNCKEELEKWYWAKIEEMATDFANLAVSTLIDQVTGRPRTQFTIETAKAALKEAYIAGFEKLTEEATKEHHLNKEAAAAASLEGL